MKNENDVIIAGAVRTAIGAFGGSLAGIPAPELGTMVLREALRRAGLAPEAVDEVMMGQVLQAGGGLNVARQIVVRAGLPLTVPAFTVNKVCASGMKAIALAAMSVRAGERRAVVAGGVENMSAAPFLLDKARWGYRLGDGALLDSVLSEALTDPTEGCHMGITAENLAGEFKISREAQDAFAADSQGKAAAAIDQGWLQPEIVAVDVPRRRGPALRFETDEFPRRGTTVEILGGLRPAFKKDGTVTAGNASGINDGAAAMVVMQAGEAARHGITPMARIVSVASAGVEPARMGIGPVPATRLALEKAGLTVDDLDVVELNEAFAAQSLAVLRELKLDAGKVNVHGGAIALGHPVGASGARIVVTLLHALKQRGGRYGLATLCVGGGQGMAMVLEQWTEH